MQASEAQPDLGKSNVIGVLERPHVQTPFPVIMYMYQTRIAPLRLHQPGTIANEPSTRLDPHDTSSLLYLL